MSQSKHPAAGLKEHFQNLSDPRVSRTREHELIDILMIALCTLLCGGESFNDMEDFGKAQSEWFGSFLGLAKGVPSHDTFNRVFAALKPGEFLECFERWTQSLGQTMDLEIVALDGKALRGARHKNEPMKYVVSAWSQSNSLVLGQLKVADKSNEITAVPELLRALELSGCIVTLEAMGCQKKIAREILKADADYVLALKGNQATVHEEVKTFLDDAIKERRNPSASKARLSPMVANLAEVKTVDNDHGRLETRHYYQSDQIQWFAEREQWEGLRSVGVVESIREIDRKEQKERRYYLSSLPLGAEHFAHAVRGHWGIENRLHWILDVGLREDSSRARTRTRRRKPRHPAPARPQPAPP